MLYALCKVNQIAQEKKKKKDALPDAPIHAPGDVLTDTPTVASTEAPRDALTAALADAPTGTMKMPNRYQTYNPTEVLIDALTDKQMER